MSQHDTTKVTKDYDTIIEELYQILQLKGKELFLSYLLDIKWEDPDVVRDRSHIYLPEYLIKFLKEYNLDQKKLPVAIRDFKTDLTNKCIDSLNSDLSSLLSSLKPDLTSIQLLIANYFKEKHFYVSINQLFALQIKTVQSYISSVLKSIPREIANEIRLKFREETKGKKKEYTIKEFSNITKDQFSLEQKNLQFNIIFSLLRTIKFDGVSYEDAKNLEQEHIITPFEKKSQIDYEITDKKAISEKKRMENTYERFIEQKARLFNNTYKAGYMAVINKTERLGIKHSNKLMKKLYKYHDRTLLEPTSKRGFGFIDHF